MSRPVALCAVVASLLIALGAIVDGAWALLAIPVAGMFALWVLWHDRPA